MWTIYEKKSLIKSLKLIPNHIKKAYEIWKRIVELQGVQGLKTIKGFHDEALKGEWKGFRSSRLSLQWRVIYKAVAEQLEVYIIDINAHKY
jgi:addiction module RelE/StbE family toxin